LVPNVIDSISFQLPITQLPISIQEQLCEEHALKGVAQHRLVVAEGARLPAGKVQPHRPSGQVKVNGAFE